MMAKVLNAIIVVVMIALIATFIVSALSLQNKTDQILSTYSAKRDDLAARQQQIQDMIVSLNSTFQAAVSQQQSLSTEIQNMGVQVNTTLITPSMNVPIAPTASVVNSQPSAPVVSTPVAQAPAAPVVVSQPVRRVSRAS